MYKLYQYNDNDFRLVCTKNDYLKKSSNNNNLDYYIPQDETEIDRIEISRARRMIREYILCNDFLYFFTATINSSYCDRFSLSECQKIFVKL